MENRKLTVLIVDDERVNVDILRATLEDSYHILSATEGRQALALASSELPDLILLDIVMPGMDGYAVCGRLKADNRTRDIPIMFVTGLDEEQDEAKGLEIGAIDYVSKPISPAIVRARVRNHLELKHYRDFLENLSATDSLTGIANRRHFDFVLDREWRRAMRNQAPISLIFIDIDFFKAFNDHYGHVAGDSCLRKVTQVLAESVKRPGDLVARFGGEEFVCLLPETDIEGAVMAARRIRERMNELGIPHAFSAAADRLTLSFGVAAMIPAIGQQPSDLIKSADDCLYRAKQEGRDRFVSQGFAQK